MAVNLSPVGGVAAQFLDNNGNVLTGGKIYTYAAGTTTPQASYTSAAGTTAHSNPIILDASGRVPGGEIWLTDGLQYKVAIYTADNVLIGTYDNVIGINSNFVNFVSSEEVQIATAGQTVFTLTTMQYQPGTNNLVVYVDGVNQVEGGSYSYVETNSTTVTFTSGLHVGAVVKFVSAEVLSTNVTDASTTVYTPAATSLLDGVATTVKTALDTVSNESTGSAYVGYIQSGAGAVQTTVETKLRESVSVKDFGAVGDGVADDTVAFQAAFDAAEVVNIPAGEYVLSAKLTVNDKAFTLRGSGRRTTRLKWTNADGGISIIDASSGSNRNDMPRFQLSDFGMHTTQAGGGTALYIKSNANIPEPFLTIANIDIVGYDWSADWWTTGLHVVDGTQCYYNNLYIQGQSAAPQAGTKGIYLTNTSGTGGMVHYMNQCTIKFQEVGLRADLAAGVPTIEGLSCSECLFVQCVQGVWINGTAATYQAPYWAFTTCQFDATTKECIFIENAAQVFVESCVFYGDTSASTFPLINLTDVNSGFIGKSFFNDFQSPFQRTGIFLNGTTSGVIISDCVLGLLSEGISIAATANGNYISNSIDFGTTTTPIVNLGSGNVIGAGANSIGLQAQAAGQGRTVIESRGADSVIGVDFQPKGNGLVRAVNPSNNAFAALNPDGGMVINKGSGDDPYIDFLSDSTLPIDYVNYNARIQSVNNNLQFKVGGGGPSTKATLILTDDFNVMLPELPTSAAGLPSGAIWYDPADGNRLKFVP